MECPSRLIVLESFQNCTIYHDLVILQFSSDNAKRIVYEMVIKLNLWESRRASTRYPFLVHVVVDHHRRSGGWYAHFADSNMNKIKQRVLMILKGAVFIKWKPSIQANLRNAWSGDLISFNFYGHSWLWAFSDRNENVIFLYIYVLYFYV